MTVLCQMAKIRFLSFQVEDEAGNPLRLKANFRNTKLLAAGGESRGTFEELLFEKWNEMEVPSDPGVHTRVEFADRPHFIEVEGELTPVIVFAKLEVGHDRYLGDLTEEQAAVLSGDGEESEDDLAMPDIENEWQIVPEAEPDPEVEVVFVAVSRY